MKILNKLYEIGGLGNWARIIKEGNKYLVELNPKNENEKWLVKAIFDSLEEASSFIEIEKNKLMEC